MSMSLHDAVVVVTLVLHISTCFACRRGSTNLSVLLSSTHC